MYIYKKSERFKFLVDQKSKKFVNEFLVNIIELKKYFKTKNLTKEVYLKKLFKIYIEHQLFISD